MVKDLGLLLVSPLKLLFVLLISIDTYSHDFLDDYSMYANIAPATAQKSKSPVATIGGEPDGRPPVIVDEPIPSMPIEKGQTTVAFGKAEPGVDIFAGEPIKEIKSEQVVPLIADEKEISSVFSNPSLETLLEAKKGEEPKNAAASMPDPAVADVKDAHFNIQTHPSTEANVGERVHKQPQGPVEEPVAEAIRAAKELYPEAH